MAVERTRALSEVLDQLESAAQRDCIAVDEVVQQLGRTSFASLLLVFWLGRDSVRCDCTKMPFAGIGALRDADEMISAPNVRLQ